MSKRIVCDCGFAVLGDTDQELLAKAREHIQASHASLVGEISDQDLLAAAEEV
jgi:predicted small metal-binding protein